MKKSIRTLGATATAVGVVGVVGLGIAVAGPSENKPIPAERSPATADLSAAKHLGVFRGDPTSSDQAPADVARFLAGANPKLARAVTATLRDGKIWLVPSSDGVCVTSERHIVGGCATPSEIDAGQAVQSTICAPNLSPSEIQVNGIVPDGVTSVTIVRDGAPAEQVDVQNNVWIYTTSRSGPLPVAVKWSDPTGATHEHSTTVPPDAAEDNCAA